MEVRPTQDRSDGLDRFLILRVRIPSEIVRVFDGSGCRRSANDDSNQCASSAASWASQNLALYEQKFGPIRTPTSDTPLYTPEEPRGGTTR